MKRHFSIVTFTLGCIVAACSGPQEPDPVSMFDTAPIQIDSVDVSLLEIFPVQATVHVTGVLGDGCAELESIEQRRDGPGMIVKIDHRKLASFHF